MGKVLLYTRSRPPQPPEAAAQNARDDEAHARCVSFVRANARGEVEGLFGPDSVSWAMYREPATLFAGLSAVMLQMAHPAIAAGVSQHSTFAEDLRGRAARTSAALYRLATPSEGCVRIDGIDVAALNLAELRHRINVFAEGTWFLLANLIAISGIAIPARRPEP